MIGPAAKDAVPALAEVLKDKDDLMRSGAALALGRVGPAAVPTLTELAKDKDAGVRRAAAWSLGGIEPAAENSYRELLLKDRNGGVGYDAKRALTSISRGTRVVH
jgi:HEAT repeat protein